MAITKGVNATAIDTNDPFDFLAPGNVGGNLCLLYTSPSPRDRTRSRMPSSA